MSERLPTESMRRAARKARISRGLRPKNAFHARRLAEMVRQEGQELPQVARIGLDRFGREPPLLGERGKPRHRLPARVVRAGKDEIED